MNATLLLGVDFLSAYAGSSVVAVDNGGRSTPADDPCIFLEYSKLTSCFY